MSLPPGLRPFSLPAFRCSSEIRGMSVAPLYPSCSLFYSFPPYCPYSISLMYIWAGMVSKLCLPIAAWKDKLDVIRFVDCIHYYIHRSHTYLYTRAHAHAYKYKYMKRASPAYSTLTRTVNPHDIKTTPERQPLRQDSPRWIANAEIVIDATIGSLILRDRIVYATSNSITDLSRKILFCCDAVLSSRIRKKYTWTIAKSIETIFSKNNNCKFNHIKLRIICNIDTSCIFYNRTFKIHISYFV